MNYLMMSLLILTCGLNAAQQGPQAQSSRQIGARSQQAPQTQTLPGEATQYFGRRNNQEVSYLYEPGEAPGNLVFQYLYVRTTRTPKGVIVLTTYEVYSLP